MPQGNKATHTADRETGAPADPRHTHKMDSAAEGFKGIKGLPESQIWGGWRAFVGCRMAMLKRYRMVGFHPGAGVGWGWG